VVTGWSVTTFVIVTVRPWKLEAGQPERARGRGPGRLMQVGDGHAAGLLPERAGLTGLARRLAQGAGLATQRSSLSDGVCYQPVTGVAECHCAAE
jgi:hypothetical protein